MLPLQVQNHETAFGEGAASIEAGVAAARKLAGEMAATQTALAGATVAPMRLQSFYRPEFYPVILVKILITGRFLIFTMIQFFAM